MYIMLTYTQHHGVNADLCSLPADVSRGLLGVAADRGSAGILGASVA